MTGSRRRKQPRPKRPEPPKGLFLLALVFIAGLAGWFAWRQLPAPPTPNLAPRVLFSETAGCTQRERLLVAGVMHNRVRNPAFGNCPSLHAVVAQPGAFSCINDESNGNWRKTLRPAQLSQAEQAVWQNCLAILNHDIPTAAGPSRRPLVYYHDKTITKPRSWDNVQWSAVREIATEHFIFYSIVPTPPIRRWFTPHSS